MSHKLLRMRAGIVTRCLLLPCSTCRGRKVHDVNPLRPQSGIGPHSLGLVSAVCGVWPLMLLGDADGTLMAWDLMHGRCSSIATGERHDQGKTAAS